MTQPALSSTGNVLLRRRDLFSHTVSGLSGMALASLLHQDGLLAGSSVKIDPLRPHAPRRPHYPARAKNVLVIFCAGACSQLETYDYKPELIKRDGMPLAGGPAVTFQGPAGNLARPQYDFRPRGECGKMVSEMIPHLGGIVDDLAFVHTLTSKSNTHGPAENFLSTGFALDGFPSMGAWVSYALGTENQNLPAFVAIPDPRGVPQASIKLNQNHLQGHPDNRGLAARIASYELAAKMQLSVPRITDLSRESESTLRMYGADSKNETKAAFARNAILARRLIENGVRFVQLFNGAYASSGRLNWDGHQKLREQYDVHGEILDQPAAALFKDLKQRGLLSDTLVVWCTEFGRMPMFQKGAKGRDHNPQGFTAWLGGAGIKKGASYGVTDELGFKAVENVSSVHDLNATILHLLGLDHTRLTFRHNGIDRRLTDVHGHVLGDLLS